MSRAVLIVEDDPVNMDVLTRFMRSKGFAPAGAGSAEEALGLLGKASFDAILLDNVLPGMTGLQAISELASRSRAPIVVMTGHADEELRKDALMLGAKAFLYKPFDFGLLLRTVEEVLAQK